MFNVPAASPIALQAAMQYGLRMHYEAEGFAVTYYVYQGRHYVTDMREVSSQYCSTTKEK